MHIVFVTTELATEKNSSGGLASFTANMARIFAANGHQVTILLMTIKEEHLTFDQGITLETAFVKKSIWELLNKAASICVLGNKKQAVEIRKVLISFYRTMMVRNRLNKINADKKIDVVHYCSLGAPAFWASRNIPYVIRISSLPSINNVAHQYGGNIGYEIGKLSIQDKMIEGALSKARYIISPSNLYANKAKEQFAAETVVIESPYVFSKGNWDERLYRSMVDKKKYIIHYGRLRYAKGTYLVGQIAKEFLQEHTSFYIVLAGKNEDILDDDGNRMKADEFVKKCAGQFSDRVIYVGRLTREQLYPFVQNAELCLFPSRIENLSNACIEAMAMGKIVVATNGASYEQLIEDKVSGFLCERDNPTAYLKAINEVLSMDKNRKEKMSTMALKITERLEAQKIYRQYLEFYEKVMREWDQ